MTNRISIFYSAEGIAKLELLEIAADSTFADVKSAIVAKHGLAADSSIFVEDDKDKDDDDDDDAADKDVDESETIARHASAHGHLKVHVHRCKRIEVAVSYNARTVERRFRPGATIARVKRWAANKLKLSRDEAGEHVLQLSGTTDRPPPNTHVGALAKCPACQVRFDLVPNERVNGAAVPQ